MSQSQASPSTAIRHTGTAERQQPTKTRGGDYNAYFDITTETLYLNDADISNNSGNGIEADKDLIIDCTGTNTVTGSSDGIDASLTLTIKGSGSLSVAGGNDGIHTAAALTVKGDVNLSATGTENYGVFAQKDIRTSNSGNLKIQGKKYGIYGATSPMSSTNSVCINTQQDVSVSSSEGTGIYAYYGNISVTSESGKVTIAAGSTAVQPYAGTATISGYNDVTITPGQYGIWNDRSSSDVNVASTNGSVSVTGLSGVIASKSGVNISAAKDVTLSGTSGVGVGGTAVSVAAGENLSITGSNVGVNAFGTGDVTLDAGGTLHVKGDHVKGINCQNGTVKLSGTVPAEDTLTITNNTMVPEGKTLTNNGTITLDDGKTFTVQGTLVNNGTITPEPVKGVVKWMSLLSNDLKWSDHIEKNGTTYTVKSALGLAWIAGVTDYNNTVTADTYQNDPELPGDSTFDGYSVVLANDIDLSGNQWVPIGNCDDAPAEFKGTFNGNAHVISGMDVSGFRFSGLFGEIGEHGTVKNFTISGTANGTYNDSYDPYVGGAAGHNSGVISNVISHAAVSAYGNGLYAGGIAGGNGGTIQNCISAGTVSGENLGGMAGVGGICGSNRADSALVQNCYSMSTVSSIGDHVRIGGLVGWNYYYEQQGTVKNSYWYNDGKLINGVGDISNAHVTITSVGSFTTADSALTATDGTTLTYTGTLLTALNAWVGAQSDSTLKSWVVNSAVNSGYPVFGGKITYVLGDGNWADGYTALATYAQGAVAVLPTAANVTRSGYTFSGWTKTNGADDTDYLTNISAKSSGNITVYAKWSAAPTKNSSKSIVSFAIGSSIGTMNEINHTAAVTVPYGTSLKALMPAITVSKNAVVSPASGAAQDFSKPVTYMVTAEDGSKQDYIVTVTVGANPNTDNGGSSNNHPNGSDTSTPAVPSTTSTTTNAAGGTVATVTTVPSSAPTISGNQAAISVAVPADVTSVITSSTAEKPAEVAITFPTTSIVEQINNSAVQTVDLTVTVPTVVANNANANTKIIMNAEQSVLQAAKNQKKDVCISVVNSDTGKEAYSWTFKGADLASSAAAVKSVDLAMSVHLTTEVAPVNAVTQGNKGLVLSFANNGVLPSAATIKINAADKGYKAGQTLYFYYFNQTTKQLEQVGNSAAYTVDANGFVSVTITHCSDYVLLPKAVRSIMLDTTSYTMALKGSYQIGSKLMGAENTVLKVYSTNNGIATVTKLANGNYQVTGKGFGTAYIMYDVYDKKNKRLTHASVRVNVKNGVKAFGDSRRQIGML